MSLAGRVALVTGAAGGLGSATAAALARVGARVLVLDLPTSPGDRVAAEIEKEAGPGTARFVPADLADLDATRVLVADLAADCGAIDILVNNAAIYPRRPFDEYTTQEWQQVQRINADAAFVCAQAVVPGMRRTGSGRIINIASITFFGGFELLAPYVTSKGALVGLTRALARELGPYGITVNVVAPGAFPTAAEMIHPDHEGYERFVLDHQAVKRRGRPEDIANAVLFFAAEESGFITGQLLAVDGGWVMHLQRGWPHMGVLDSYRVLDLSIAMSGPFAAMRLGDLGADVIKVEPVTGEWQRHVSAGGAQGNRVNVSFLALNRNKRSLAVNLKSDAGRRLVHELARTADVVLQNYRPGVAARLGMDYETIRAINPRIVYVSISGYGETGPYAARPGQDLILQGLSGAMLSAGRRTDPPQPSPMYVVDAVTAYTAFEAALAGLLHRERTGEGQLIEVNMLDAIVTLQMQEMSVFTVGGQPQRRTTEPHAHCFIRAPYGAFRAADGYLTLAFPPLPKLGEVLGIPELTQMDDEVDGHARRDEIHRLVADRLQERPASEWLALFAEHDIWAGPVYSYSEVVADPQVLHNGTLVSYRHPTEGEVTTPGFAIRFGKTPSEVRCGAPLAGEHSREILAELGLSDQQVDGLLAAGVVATEQP